MSRKRISLRQELPLLVWLVIVWAALWQNFSPGNLLFGALIAVLVARLFYLPPVELGGRFNLLRAVPFGLTSWPKSWQRASRSCSWRWPKAPR